MEPSRFSTSFVGKTIQSGSKMTGSAYPSLTVASTKDKFVLNQKAMALMGIGEGDNVVMIDLNKGNVITENSNERWYITKGWDKGKGNVEGAKIGKNGSFSYAGIYSAMQMNKPDISEANIKDMVAAGVGITRATKGDKEAFIATQKINFKVSPFAQPSTIEGEPDITSFEVAKDVHQPVFALTEMEVIEHTPREVGEESEDSEDSSQE